MPWHYRGLWLCYAIVRYGGDPYIRLFENRRGRDFFLRNAKSITKVEGIGVVNYYPEMRPEPGRFTRVTKPATAPARTPPAA